MLREGWSVEPLRGRAIGLWRGELGRCWGACCGDDGRGEAWRVLCDLHALPDGWEEMAYADFLVERRRLLADVIRRGFEALA